MLTKGDDITASLDFPLCSVGINVIAIDFEKQSGFSYSLLVGHGIQARRVPSSHVVVIFETKASSSQIQYPRGFHKFTVLSPMREKSLLDGCLQLPVPASC